MNVTDPTSQKPVAPPPTITVSTPNKSKPENKLMDAVSTATAPAAGEKANLIEFAKQASQPVPTPSTSAALLPNVPVTGGAKNGTAGAALRAALPPNAPNAKALYESARAPNPNTTVGPIAHELGGPNPTAGEKDCKMGGEIIGEIPIIGKPLKNEIDEACKKSEEPTMGPLSNVPVTASKGTALGKP